MRIPADVQPKLGRTEVSRSLRTSNYGDAVRLARKVAYEIECMFDQARLGAGFEVTAVRKTDEHDGKQSHPNSAESIIIDVEKVAKIIADKVVVATTPQLEPNLSPIAGKTIKEIYDLYMADPTRSLSPKSKLAYDSIYGLLVELIGETTPISEVTREACRDVLDVLRFLPSNSTKRYPKLTTRQAAEKARKEGLDPISAATVNGYLRKLSSLLAWAVNEGYLDRNPAKGLTVIDTIRKKDKRQPFSVWQLRKIFDAPLYRGCLNDGAGYATPGNDRPRGGRFWVPLIGLYSGMRLNEICQLNAEDVRMIDGVHCFIVTTDVRAGLGDKKIKTANGERVVPVHPELVRIGF